MKEVLYVDEARLQSYAEQVNPSLATIRQSEEVRLRAVDHWPKGIARARGAGAGLEFRNWIINIAEVENAVVLLEKVVVLQLDGFGI